MRKFLIAAAGLLSLTLAAPAVAGTLEEVIAHGMVLKIQDMDIVVVYTPDGKFTAADGQITGEWKIDGEKLCSNSNFDPNFTCLAYPKDKKSGDSFELTSPQGAVTVKIR